MEKVTVYYSIQNCGDGSASLYWFTSQELASKDQETQGDDGWGEDCSGSVETFIGSDIHEKALKNTSFFEEYDY